VKTEEEAAADEKGPYSLHSEVEKAVKGMRDQQATGDDNVSGDIVKWMGENNLKIVTAVEQHICNWRVAPRI
jgi:hypothetical protein